MMAILGSWLAVASIQGELMRWSALAAFIVLGVGLLVLEQISDNAREQREDALHGEMRKRVDAVHSRLAGVVASGSLKDRTIRLALELQNFALDAEPADGRSTTRAQLTSTYNTYRERFGPRVAEIERELREAGVMDGCIEDYVLATVVPEDNPITSDQLDTDEWRLRPRSVDSLAEFLWQRAADL
jgi:hypothetical protein